jgi:hypothetical protein
LSISIKISTFLDAQVTKKIKSDNKQLINKDSVKKITEKDVLWHPV